jgi:hypothetical protein
VPDLLASGDGTMTGNAPPDMSQCAIDCSTYCRVLKAKLARAESGCMKQALMPILGLLIIVTALP